MSNARDFCTRALSLLIILATGALVGIPVVRHASATHDPTDFTIMALFSGWNSTLPAGTLSGCSPTGTTSCNPPVREFRGVAFTVTIVWKDFSHNVAIYTKNTAPAGVSSAHTCSPPGTNGCWARSTTVSSPSATTALLTFTPTVPPNDFSGDGGYEYYCQFHATTMHGKVTVSKSPDLDGDGSVTIVDIATIATAFESTPASPNWNIAADIDNDGNVDIIDVAKAASYFGKILVD